MKKRIVVVEDESGISLPVKDQLEYEGFEVELMTDGASALRRIVTAVPDLVLLDLMLPGMNGLDVCREIRRRGLEVPVIMLTAKAQEVDRVVGLEIGADDYITKPFSLRELVARIRARLRHRTFSGAGARFGSSVADLGGRTVSHYRMVEQIGAGGMGIVYKAEDQRLERWVALKFLFPYLALDSRGRERLVMEARAASVLDHPNIGTIYEIDQTEEGYLFIAMAYYEGETLKEVLDRGRLAPATALDLIVQAAEGLARAHDRGIVHRDVKPSNLIVTREGVVKVVDFGLAKLAEKADGTTGGSVFGTPGYAAPEQIRGALVGPAADVWSLGVVLVEAILGRRPSHDAPERDLEELAGLGFPGIDAVARKALALQPVRRYRYAREMLDDLVALRRLRATAG